MVNVFAIGSFITAGFTAFFVIFSLINKGKRSDSWLFALMNLSLFVWSFGYGFWQISDNPQSALFFLKFLMCGATFIPVFYLHYTLSFLGISQKYKIQLFFAYLLSFVFLVYTILPEYIISGLYRIKYFQELSFDYWPIAGSIFPFWLSWFILAFLIGQLLLYLRFKQESGIFREQIRYFFIGALIAVLGGGTVFPLWYKINLLPVGVFIIFLYPLLLFYSAARYRFMDISFVVGRGFIYFATYLTIIGSAFLLVLVHNYLGYSFSPLYLWPTLLVLGIICYQPLFAFYERIAEKYFYYTYHSYQKALSDLGRKANRFLELDKLSTLLLDTICEIMHLDKAAIAIKNEKGDVAIIQSRGFERSKLQYFLKGDFLEIYLGECLKPVSIEDIPELAIKAVNNDYEKRRFHDLGQEMKKAAVNLCLPLAVEDKLSGVILLGNKNVSDQFSEQDISLLGALAMHASIALQNAQYYSRIKSFGARLENSVRQKTNELEEANERLKQLDKAKSEFVSIASHQLRAPLTIIKGYLAVIKDGDYGKAPADAQARLATAYKANEQLISFTNDLLDMSRLESGKTVLKSEEIDLGAIVASVVLQLTPEAQKTGIALSFEKPSAKIIAKGDRQACEQAIYNVIANSMAHTPRGKISVKLESAKNMHKVSVRDNGEGFSHDDLKNIFNKQPPASSEGVGLSLVSGIAMYLAKKMAEMQKGKIKVESEGLGQGTTYEIYLPIS